MTATTNGASLEDCLTNIFSLIDLNGIRWKRFKHKDNNNYLYTPIDTHPILTTYARCIEENHIAVWRHEPHKKYSTAGGGTSGSGGPGAGGSTGQHSNFPTPTRNSNNNTPTGGGPSNNTINSGNQNSNSAGQNQNHNNYELWIFGYGNQLKVDNVIGEDLAEIEDETWESKGLSYECRTLLFKALHNLIERCFLAKGFTKLGRWFVQPSFESNLKTTSPTDNLTSSRTLKQPKLDHGSSISSSNTKSAHNLSSTISSTVNRIIESHSSRQCLDKSDGLRRISSRSSSTYFTSSLDGSKSSLSFAFSFFVHGDSTICATVDVRQHPLVYPITRSDMNTFQDGGIVRVALAPFGLNGVFNGVSYKDCDNGAATATFIQQWSRFYPLPKTLARLAPGLKSTNSAIANNKPPSANSNQYNQPGDCQTTQNSRSYLSSSTNILLSNSQKPPLSFNYEPDEVPPIVEVIVAGYRMRYPSECVFTTSKVVDLYKSLNSPLDSRSMAPNKRPNKGSLNKHNKSPLLIERSTSEQTNTQIKIKQEPDQAKIQTVFNSPFSLPSSDSTKKILSKLDGTSSKVAPCDSFKDKNSNGCQEQDGNNASDRTAVLVAAFKEKIGIPNYNLLGPTDLVKLFPTPPSLEQTVVSPSAVVDESATKDTATLSPTNTSQNNQFFKDNGVDVYKPVECALMPPPSKWAALTNVTISSSKSLPPECIYKESPQSKNSKSFTNKLNEPIKSSSLKNSPATRQLPSSTPIRGGSVQSIPSPLTDQTNKNGFNLNTSPPKPSNILFSYQSSTFNQSPVNNLTTTPAATPTSTPNATSTNQVEIFSSFTLPHQRLFNNLNEINSIQLNLLISDSALGMLKDHNFESCTLCVCNMSIRGAQIDTIPQKIDGVTQWRQSLSLDTSAPTNEFTNECTCGFSAITNRHCSHLSGLFLEDELELTNVLYDPTEMIDQNKLFRKVRLSNYSDSSHNEEQKHLARSLNEMSNKTGSMNSDEGKDTIKQEKTHKEDISSQTIQKAIESVKVFVIDQLRQQCSSPIHSNSSLLKVLFLESFRNNRHLTCCSNYYAQTSNKTMGCGIFNRFLDDSTKYTHVKMLNRNPMSLKFSDFCELTKSIVSKLANQNQGGGSRLSGSAVKPLGAGNTLSGLAATFSRMFGANRQNHLLGGKANSIGNVFLQGLQALVIPTLSIDPKGALQMLEYLVKDESKEALATLNKAILIFSSPIHDWQFLTTPIPENNFDIVNLLKVIQPSLDESIGTHNKLYKDFIHQQQQHIFSARDSPTGAPTVPTPPCQGPLTWRQFHQSSGRGTEDQCEPQPIPSLLVGHFVEKNHLALSPFALKFWDKLLLEPYAPSHNLFYLIVAPDNASISGHLNSFFKELSNTYELMKLGKHAPIGSGLVLANMNSESSVDDDWFSYFLNNDRDISGGIIHKLKNYMEKMNAAMAKTIIEFIEDRQPPHYPHNDRFDSSPSPSSAKSSSHLTSSRTNQPTASQPLNHMISSSQQQDSFNYNTDGPSQNEALMRSQSLINSNVHGNSEDNVCQEDEANKQTGIVIYMIDPFSSPSISQNLRVLSTIGLLKCYSNLLDQLPESIKKISQLQLISLDSIVSHSRPIMDISRVDQLKSLSLNIYSRCRKILINQTTAKSLTGFGPAAALDAFFKTKNQELSVAKMFTPPFMLAPMKDKQTELGEMFGDRREKSSVLFCSYCITEDQRWLLASITNDKGEMSETTVININILDRLKNPKTSVKRNALRKLMEFIVSVMSEWVNPWRLVIGKLGRVGHGELKEWASLMSKRSLMNYSRLLTERCQQCTMLPANETVSILSACLVSLEPDSKLRIMPEQFTSDDRQASFNKCPLSTPEDASATHILVFPTSASIQSAHGNGEDPLLVGSGLDDDLLNQFPLEDGIEDLGVEDNMDDLFSTWDDNAANASDHINSHHDNMMSSSNLQMGSGSVGDHAGNQDETLQLLQQPLALGYYISTAKIGQMPNWFWSTSPHLRNSCPVFLKSALHIHMPCVQLSDDLLHSGVGQSRKSHQLDSNLTTDVLRYVLEGYNSLSWLALNPKTYDRQSCLPVHMQNLLQLYHLMESFS